MQNVNGEVSFGLSELANVVDDVDAMEVETPDYLNFDLIPVGNYLSRSRTVSAISEKTDEKTGRNYLSFTMELTGGIINTETGKEFGKGAYPLKTWISTKPFQKDNRPGSTTSVADYLRATGVDPRGEGTLQEKLEASLALPVMVFIAWNNRGEKTGRTLPNGKPEYTKSVLKTKDFNTGTKENPVYVSTIEKDGVTYTAQHKVSSFSKIKA